jgi:tetrahydromethanopterin S-methyltransferase subunit G
MKNKEYKYKRSRLDELREKTEFYQGLYRY